MPSLHDDAIAFAQLFSGNAIAHYVLLDPKTKRYEAVTRGLAVSDLERHLSGEPPSVLSIPVMTNGRCYFGALDVDRHNPDDPPVDHVALAKKVTELKLPLVPTRSKGDGCHLWLFFKEQDGFPAEKARDLLKAYLGKLSLDPKTEIFPKQEKLNTEKGYGSGINLPYFGEQRTGLGKQGEELTLHEFLELAKDRQSFGSVLVDRDLTELPIDPKQKLKAERPLTVGQIRSAYQKLLEEFRAMTRPEDNQNTQLNTCSFFAGRAFASGALPGTIDDVQNELRAIANSTRYCPGVEPTLRSGWESGVKSPFKIVTAEQAHLDALASVDSWRLDRDVPAPSLDDAATDLSLLTDEEYAERRSTVAKRLKVKSADLDKAVRKRRPESVLVIDENEFGLTDTEPWPDAVDGMALFDAVAATICRFIIFPRENDTTTCVLWVMGTHCYMDFDIFPRFNVTAMSKNCGKTTLLHVMQDLTERPLALDNVTTAFVFRATEAGRATLVIDEFDSFIEKDAELIGILNSGHAKGGFVGRMEKDGDRMVPRRFKTFAPVLYGMIGKPPGTLGSRSLFVQLLRKRPDQATEDYDRTDHPELVEQMTVLRRKIARWVKDHRQEVTAAKPDTKSLSNRARDNWRPLLKLASVLGCVGLAYAAAGIEVVEWDDMIQTKLLRDLRNIFFTRKAKRLPSQVLVSDLLLQAQNPWPKFHHHKDPMNEHDLARILTKDLGIRSCYLALSKDEQLSLFGKIRPNKLVLRGYNFEDFEQLIDHQLAGEEPAIVDLSREEEMF